MMLNQSFINRRKALWRTPLGIAAPGVLAAGTPVAEASAAPELVRLIEAHRSAKLAADGAINQDYPANIADQLEKEHMNELLLCLG